MHTQTRRNTRQHTKGSHSLYEVLGTILGGMGGGDGGRGNLCLYLTYFFCHFILFKIKSHVALAGPMQMQQTVVSIKCGWFKMYCLI